jgi:hypothetical protein
MLTTCKKVRSLNRRGRDVVEQIEVAEGAMSLLKP